MRKLSENGLVFLKLREGLPGGLPALEAYQDQGGKWTIGWGHCLNVKEGHTITEQFAEKILESDLRAPQKAVSELVEPILTDNQFTALVSFAFNEGCVAFKTSSLLKRINAGDFQGAAKEFLRWIWYHDRKSGEVLRSDGLFRRREMERKLFEAL